METFIYNDLLFHKKISHFSLIYLYYTISNVLSIIFAKIIYLNYHILI